MKYLIAVALALVTSIAVAETPSSTTIERPTVCPVVMDRAGFACLVGWSDARGNLVCTQWARTRSIVTGLDKFGKAATEQK